MDAYAPRDPATLALVVLTLAALLGAGLALARAPASRAAAAAAWTLLVAGTAVLERLTAAEPAGVRMLALIAGGLLSMKAIVSVAERARGGRPLPWPRWLAFAVGWPGMRPRLFEPARARPLPGSRALAGRGALRLATGALLVAAAAGVAAATGSRLLATLLLLPGLSLALHFGLLDLLAAAWRRRGVPCEPLFRAPLRSRTLAEFWGRRWNAAFSEMSALAVHRPLARALGGRPALLATFLFSGLLHEMAISLPVRAGFGLPLAYFALQGVLVLLERPPGGPPPRAGRGWTAVRVLAPLPLLFHRPFLEGVAWPLLGLPPAA